MISGRKTPMSWKPRKKNFLKSGWNSNTLWLIKCTARDRRRVSVVRLLHLREADYCCLEFQVHRETLRVWPHNVKGDNEDDEENIKGDIERVEEQMKSCFIKNKRGKKRQLSWDEW